jgi:16S rRNA A1518/A1519 N6-dimethyltransferase RsmA/KsgA/DIM1 with predicted DNA glycosylase/AP lyase activity
MTVIVDPEGISTSTLLEHINFDGKRVFEIGCGEGRITFDYADHANQVTAIDPKFMAK